MLSPFERFAFRLTWRMNRGRWKRFWTFCQRSLGAGWIHLSTYNLMRVSGLEHVEAASRERPLLLVANHRSFFDMYVVSTVLFRRTPWRKQLFFPVRGRFFYDTVGGLLVNLLMGWWSMFPPFFAGGDNPKVDKREFDKFSMRLLAAPLPRRRGQRHRLPSRRHAQQGRRPLLLPARAARRRQAHQGRTPAGHPRLHRRARQRPPEASPRQLARRRARARTLRPRDRFLGVLRTARLGAHLQGDCGLRHVEDSRAGRAGPRRARARSPAQCARQARGGSPTVREGVLVSLSHTVADTYALPDGRASAA